MKKKYLALGLILVMTAVAGINLYLGSTTESSSGQLTINVSVVFGISDTKSRIITTESPLTAFDALEMVAVVNYTEYPSMGRLITSIDYVEQNDDNYWLYFVDGIMPAVSADKYTLTTDSNLTFRYVSSEESMKYFDMTA